MVGCGAGGTFSLDALVTSDRFALVAACDQAEAARQRVGDQYNVPTFASHEAMFGECPTDIVCVSTWAPSHGPITLDALALPLTGILVEKPLGDTTSAGRELLDAIRTRSIPVCVPHGLLYLEHAAEILRRVHNGEIGDLKLVEIQCTGWDIINAGIHWLNYFVTLALRDPIQYVMAQCDASTRTYRDGMQVETVGVTYAETQSGVRVVMQTGDHVNVNREGRDTLFRLVGTAGVIEFWGWQSAYHLVNASCPGGTLFEPERGPASGHQRCLELLATQMDAREPDYEIAESSLAALEMVEAAYLSARHGVRVALPLSAFVSPAASDWQPGLPYSGSGGGRDGRRL